MPGNSWQCGFSFAIGGPSEYGEPHVIGDVSSYTAGFVRAETLGAVGGGRNAIRAQLYISDRLRAAADISGLLIGEREVHDDSGIHLDRLAVEPVWLVAPMLHGVDR